MTIRFGIVGSAQQSARMPEPAWFRRAARTAEELRYDSLWATDHISFKNPILEGMVALSFFAGCTSRITLGTGIFLLPLRHPSIVAKQVASVHHLSGGRIIFGVGVGGEGDKDFEAVGVPREQRGARTDEAIDVLRLLWTTRDADFHGEHFSFTGITIDPSPLRSPPIWVGGRADAALVRAGRLSDGWLAYFQSPQGLAKGLATIRRHAEAAGRDPADVTPAVMLPTYVDPDGNRARRQIQAHMTARYARPFEAHLVERYCLAGTPAECVDRLGAYLDAGATHVLFNPAGDPDQFEHDAALFAESIAGPLRPRAPSG